MAEFKDAKDCDQSMMSSGHLHSRPRGNGWGKLILEAITLTVTLDQWFSMEYVFSLECGFDHGFDCGNNANRASDEQAVP